MTQPVRTLFFEQLLTQLKQNSNDEKYVFFSRTYKVFFYTESIWVFTYSTEVEF